MPEPDCIARHRQRPALREESELERCRGAPGSDRKIRRSLEADPARGIVVASGVGRIRRPLSCGVQSPAERQQATVSRSGPTHRQPGRTNSLQGAARRAAEALLPKGRLTSADLLRDSNGNRASRPVCYAFHELRRLRWSVLVVQFWLGRLTIPHRSAVCNSGSEGSQFHTAAPFWRPTSHDTPLRTARNSFTGRRLRFNEFLDHTGSDSLLTQAISHRDLRGTAITEVRLTRGLCDSAYR